MNNRPERLSDIDAAAASMAPEFEGEIREFIRRDVSLRRSTRLEPEASSPGGSINGLLDRVAGTSIDEIDRVIGELQAMRDTLATEGERVQHEVAQFANLSQAAMASLRLIAESLDRWREPEETPSPAAE